MFEWLREAGLKLKPEKCSFFQEQVPYLGHIVSRDGIKPDPEKVQKVSTWPVPTRTKEVQKFLGFATYYQHFIRNFAQIAKPLHCLTECGASFRWSEDCQYAFKDLRVKLTTAPVHAYPNFAYHRLTECGASFRWSEDCQYAFKDLWVKLTTAPVLAYPNFEKPFTLDTDASDFGIGAVLSQ